MKTLISSLALTLMALSAQAKDIIIDVRSPQEFAAGHVEGAINIEHSAIAQAIAKAGVSKDDTVLLYCQSGRRSGIALDTLKNLGFSKAENVGGIEQARKTLAKK
ncbi:MAG: rhodanese-like domain-containing protein [Curvibacter sp.]|nr:MAG: rhodanese-like domain-containing protein [Curvibacter sp.]